MMFSGVGKRRMCIEFHLEGLVKDGQPLPEPSSIVEYVELKAAQNRR
jgi:hypothetical protein